MIRLRPRRPPKAGAASGRPAPPAPDCVRRKRQLFSEDYLQNSPTNTPIGQPRGRSRHKRRADFFRCKLTQRGRHFLFPLIGAGVYLLYFLLLFEETSALNSIIASQQSKHSGQFHISQLCAGKSQFPVIKRVEGAVLSSIGDSDVNCSITFRTKSAHQHFAIRFEQLKLGCDDHLRLVDSDVDYGPFTIKDFSCKDSLASVPLMKTTGTYLTLRFTTDARTHETDGFRFVITALFDTNSDCPADYSYCQNHLCISKYLFCDQVNHCIDGSDEAADCGRFTPLLPEAGWPSVSLTLTGAVVLLVFIIFIIVIVTLIVLWCINCKADQGAYAQYQHQLQRTIGLPLQSSASLMFANNQQLQYQYFQPQLSPYVTPQHQPAASLPRGYSTLPLNLARQNQQNQIQHGQPNANQLLAPEVQQGQPNAAAAAEYFMMTGLTPAQAMQPAPQMQTNLFLPNSHSIMATGIRYPMNAPTPLPRPLQQQQQTQNQQADQKR